MDEKLFEELVESVKEGGVILRGDRKPSRSFKIFQKDVQAIRHEIGLSQDQFANMMGISVKTLKNWEQGRRRPEGSARILLRVAALYPEVLIEVTKKKSILIQGDMIAPRKNTTLRRKTVQRKFSSQ